MKDLLNGIPKKRVVIDITLSSIFSLLNCGWTTLVTRIVSQRFDNTIMAFLVGLFAYVAVWNILEFFGDVYMEITCVTAENNISRYYVRKLYDIMPEILKKKNTGYIAGVLQKLIEKQLAAYKSVICEVPICIIYILYFSFALSKYSALYGMVLLMACVTSNALRWIINDKYVFSKAEKLIDAEGNRSKVTIDLISNMNTVQKMGAVDYADSCVEKENNNCMEADKNWVIYDEIAFVLAKGIMFAYFPICLVIMYYIHDTGAQNDVVFLALLAAVSTQAVHNSKALFRAMKAYSRFSSAVKKLDFVKYTESQRKPICKEMFEYADIRDLTYSYNERHGDCDKTVEIKIPEFHLQSGDFVCITGESGQGKTTLLDILSGQIETDNVLINGKIRSQRLKCVFVSQDTEIFDMSLRDNLTLGRFVWDSDLENYLNEVGMYEWYHSQPDGMNTMLGERGVFVSTGQRQRLNLIRGLVCKNQAIYLLDEPTSNVDEYTEKRMIELIQKELKGRTVVIVSHRPAIAKICNVHYEFKDGILHKV